MFQAEILSFLSCPSKEKLVQLGEMRTKLQQQVKDFFYLLCSSYLCILFCTEWIETLLYSHQVDASEPHKAADALLKIASLYSEEPETKTAVLETIGK